MDKARKTLKVGGHYEWVAHVNYSTWRQDVCAVCFSDHCFSNALNSLNLRSTEDTCYIIE